MTSVVFSRLSPQHVVAALAMAALAACGGSSETTVTTPPVDVTPATITPSTTDTLRGVVGGPASATITVTVANKSGQPIDTALVTFSVTSGGGSVSNPGVRTNAAGQATTTWTLGQTAGVQTVTATVGTLAPVTFRAVAAAGTAATITKVAGDAQTALVGTTVATPPSVKIADQFGNPVAGAVVNFTVATGGGSVTGSSVTTGANGVATLGSWRLGPTVGANTLTATSGNLTVTFSATGTVGAPAQVTLSPTAPAPLLTGQTVQLTPKVMDASGNVIASPTVTYQSSAANVASVNAAGLVTAVGAGTATVTATSGTASATVVVTVIGHPAGSSISNEIQLGGVPGDVAFTNKSMLIDVNGLQQVIVLDQTGTSTTGTLTLTTPIPLLVAPSRASGPAIAVNVGTTSRLWFIDPTVPAVIDSLDVTDIVQGIAMTSTGTRAFAMLSDGELLVVDGASHTAITRISLGGGVTAIRMAPGDTLLYAMTNVGVLFQVDVRSNTATQIPTNLAATDFTIGPDGLFYILDANANVVRIWNPTTKQVVRVVGVTPSATSIAVSPDAQQIWLTHNNPPQVTIYTGNVNTGFLSTGQFTTNNALPLRVYFNPTGNLAAITNFGGWVDIVR